MDTGTHAPVPYNGYFVSYGTHKLRLAEATYEGTKNHYNFMMAICELQPDMDYIYEFIPKQRYKEFWESYRNRYFELKKRYREAYGLNELLDKVIASRRTYY